MAYEKIIRLWWHKFQKSFNKVTFYIYLTIKKKKKIICEHNPTRLTMKTHLKISNYS